MTTARLRAAGESGRDRCLLALAAATLAVAIVVPRAGAAGEQGGGSTAQGPESSAPAALSPREELERIEIDLLQAEERIRAAAALDREISGRIADLEGEERSLEERQSLRRSRMILRLRVMYRFRHRGFLPLLFSADSAHDLLRSARYLWWIVSADQRELDEWRRLHEQSADLRGRIQRERDARRQVAGELALRREEMSQRREGLEALLGRSRDPDDRRRVRTLLQQVAEHEVDVALDLRGEEPPSDLAVVEVQPSSTFELGKGRLPMPVVGPVTRRERGIDVEVERGTQIRAVQAGFVARVQPVQGYGLVCILDHGDGWHTVYGLAEGFDVVAGDSVRAGDAIGTVGAGGTQASPRLHFEVLHHREAEDPLDWLAIPPGVRVARD